jgi:acyl-CoA thioesterase I
MTAKRVVPSRVSTYGRNIVRSDRVRRVIIALLIAGAIGFGGTAQAETVKIVAFGASNVVGRDGASYPAELQSMLTAKGYDAEVVNAGVNGDTSAGMLARVDSVPSGTRLVLLSPPTPNDTKAGILGQESGYMAQIASRLRARGIKVIELPGFAAMGAQHSASDPEHFDAAGYRTIAAHILPMVEAAIGPPR